MEDQDKKITFAALLSGVWPRNRFMIELTKNTPHTFKEFMEQANECMNTKNTLRALTESCEEVSKGERRSGQPSKQPETNRQDMELDKQSDHYLRLLHNNLGVYEDKIDKEEKRQPEVEDNYCKYYRSKFH